MTTAALQANFLKTKKSFDLSLILQKDIEQCRLIITGLDPDLHYGEWTCGMEAWNSKAEAKVVLKPDQPKVVEFLNVFEDIVVNIGESLEVN